MATAPILHRPVAMQTCRRVIVNLRVAAAAVSFILPSPSPTHHVLAQLLAGGAHVFDGRGTGAVVLSVFSTAPGGVLHDAATAG